MKKGKIFINQGIVIAITVIVFNLIQFFAISFVTRDSLLSERNIEYKEFAALYSNSISFDLEAFLKRLDFYTKAEVCETKDPAQIVDWLQEVVPKRSTSFDYVAFCDTDGTFTTDFDTTVNVSDRDYYQAIIRDGADTYVDNPVISKITGVPVIHVSKAVKVDGKTIGFFSAVIKTEGLDALVDSFRLGGEGFSALLSGRDGLIATSGDKDTVTMIFNGLDKDIPLKNTVETNCTNGTPGRFTVRAGGKTYHSFYAPVQGASWTNFNFVEEEQFFNIVRQVSLILLIAGVGTSVAIILISVLMLKRETSPLEMVGENFKEFGEGNADLTKRIEVKTGQNNEIGGIVTDFNNFTDKLREVVVSVKKAKDELVNTGSDLNASTEDTLASITEIIANIQSMVQNINHNSNSVHQTAGAVNEISSNIESLNRLIEGQSSNVTQASAAVEEMMGNISSVNNSVEKMANSFEHLEASATDGVKKQEIVNARIQDIANESEALQEANAVISSIAEQTNLLAMNAAIEAAHAGEAGKGFSVVADEIRKLSETSSEQSKTIGLQLKKITEGIQQVVAVSKNAAETFAAVSSGMNETNELILQIRAAMKEQGEGSRQISIALTNMNDSTAQVRSASEEMAEGNKSILDEVRNLQESTFSMKDGIDEMSIGAKKINENGAVLSEISSHMREAIQVLDTEVNLFKV
jgi:methyl-accepting chemotaxis protein